MCLFGQTGSTGCADAAQHVLSVTARRHKKRKKGSRAPEDSDMHPSADCGQVSELGASFLTCFFPRPKKKCEADETE